MPLLYGLSVVIFFLRVCLGSVNPEKLDFLQKLGKIIYLEHLLLVIGQRIIS